MIETKWTQMFVTILQLPGRAVFISSHGRHSHRWPNTSLYLIANSFGGNVAHWETQGAGP